MRWFLRQWPKLVGISSFMLVNVMIFRGIAALDDGTSPGDNDAYDLLAAVLISAWWGYFFAAAFSTWILAYWLKSKSIWLLLFAPIVGIWAHFKIGPDISANWLIGFPFFVFVASFPILLGASSYLKVAVVKHRRFLREVN